VRDAANVAKMRSVIDALFASAREREMHFPGPRPVIPAMHVAIVTCMDSRIDTFNIFGLQSGQAHVLRNAGGIITDDTRRSLVFSQRFLQTRSVIVMHHTDCGLYRVDEAALRAKIVAETGQDPPYEFGSFTDVDDDVRTSVLRLRDDPFLQHRDDIRGCVYEVATGHLREVV
jgi:carbonic anhydrase